MNKKHQISLITSWLLGVISLAISVYFWSKLPERIPTHFGITGAPDAWSNKSFFSIFFIPLLQLTMMGLFTFLYYKPQFSDMPTTMLLLAMPKKKREKAFELIRTMLIVTGIWIQILFLYINIGVITSSFGYTNGLNPYIMFVIMIGLFTWIGYWTVKVYRVSRKLIREK